MSEAYRNYGCRWLECRVADQRALFLENERLRVGVLVDKGADIFQFLYKPTDTEFMLHTPWGLRRPAIQSPQTAWGTFLDYYEGGWQEILPNGGPACTYRGVALGLHDEISVIPWQFQVVVDTPAEVQVALAVRPFRTPFYLRRLMRLRSHEAILTLEETLTNESGETLDFMWGHHPAFGAPFLGPECRIDLPGEALILETIEGAAGTRLGGGRHRWPLATARDGALVDFSRPEPGGAGVEDLGYVLNLPEGWYAVTNQAAQVGFALTWSLTAFPYLWVWRQFNGGADYPWYKRVYTMALEPWSSYPSGGLVTAVANGSAAQLGPGQSITTILRAVAYANVRSVKRVSPEGEIIPD